MIECAEKVIVLADSSKINKKGFWQNHVDLDRVDTIITDKGIDLETKERLQDIGVTVIISD